MNKMQVIAIEIEGQKVYFDLHRVQAVAKLEMPLTIVPHTSEEILGVINFRGRVLPVYNLNATLGLTPDFSFPYLLVLESDTVLVGVLSEKLPLIQELEEGPLYPLKNIFKEGKVEHG